MRGRRRREFEIWADAVRCWAARTDTEIAHRAVAQSRDRLRTARRYVERPGAAIPFASEHELIAYLGGFFTGEGSFGLAEDRARITVKVRRDDRPLLDLLAASTELGRVYEIAAWKTSKPSAAWIVFRRDELGRCVPLLRRANLRGRRAREFEAWRIGAMELATGRRGRRYDRDLVAQSAAALKELRAYAPRTNPVRSGCADPSAKKRALVDILTTWASELDGPLACTAYDTARAGRPHWPRRDTISLAFGSWAAALDAAGLGDRRVRGPYRRRPRARSPAA
jgi:hypothetical protein